MSALRRHLTYANVMVTLLARSGWRAIGIFLALVPVGLACAGSAYANTPLFYSSAGDPGVDFVLAGNGCPDGPRCFKHAKLTEFNGSWEVFPNCPDVNLSGGFTFGRFGGPPQKVPVDKQRRFKGHGGSTEFGGDEVTFEGRFSPNGAKAVGWFELVETNGGESCSTGRVHWSATVGN